MTTRMFALSAGDIVRIRLKDGTIVDRILEQEPYTAIDGKTSITVSDTDNVVTGAIWNANEDCWDETNE